jgi:ATP-dependent DNA ligase
MDNDNPGNHLTVEPEFGPHVWGNSQGRPSFQLLQNSLSQSRRIYFSAFDLLNGAGELLVNYELNQENGLLAQMQNAIQKKDLLNTMGTKAYEDAKKLSWVAKR